MIPLAPVVIPFLFLISGASYARTSQSDGARLMLGPIRPQSLPRANQTNPLTGKNRNPAAPDRVLRFEEFTRSHCGT